jgi:hypothetical protein
VSSGALFTSGTCLCRLLLCIPLSTWLASRRCTTLVSYSTEIEACTYAHLLQHTLHSWSMQLQPHASPQYRVGTPYTYRARPNVHARWHAHERSLAPPGVRNPRKKKQFKVSEARRHDSTTRLSGPHVGSHRLSEDSIYHVNWMERINKTYMEAHIDIADRHGSVANDGDRRPWHLAPGSAGHGRCGDRRGRVDWQQASRPKASQNNVAVHVLLY